MNTGIITSAESPETATALMPVNEAPKWFNAARINIDKTPPTTKNMEVFERETILKPYFQLFYLSSQIPWRRKWSRTHFPACCLLILCYFPRLDCKHCQRNIETPDVCHHLASGRGRDHADGKAAALRRRGVAVSGGRRGFYLARNGVNFSTSSSGRRFGFSSRLVQQWQVSASRMSLPS